MQDFEKLGVFYLGRVYDIKARLGSDIPVLYDSKDLVTHGVCVGMTGSGKTGLCICLLEEAALDGVPSIVIDPKGDITNLLLTFPSLGKDDFKPWVNAEDAMKKGLSIDDYASGQAELWKKGLAEWGQDGGRIQRLRDSSKLTIYTPGSGAGVPISILKSFEVPPQQILDDEELLQERINTMVTSLLGLIGIEGDPIKSREHILLSTIISTTWRGGSSLDLAGLIMKVQNPSVRKIGVLELESFYPSKERFALAMQLNNLLASPSFQLWLEGVPMDIGQLLYDANGKPKVSVIYIAHLSDAERMFFVSLLINNLVGWMRTQSGTTSLRAMLYIDELFGYLPPVANPPSKLPLITLLKQARAFGLGVLLATQNPVDLDYKALSNAGTWFIGRLQTERDKLRILEALETVASSAGAQLGRDDYDKIITGLGKRIFLMHNVNLAQPVVFETRWAMSYLRGPLTRDQIKILMDPIKKASQPIAEEKGKLEGMPVSPPQEKVVHEGNPPMLPPDMPQYFLPVTAALGSNPPLYKPLVLGVAQMRFLDTKNKIDATKELCFATPISDEPMAVSWGKAKEFAPIPSFADHAATGSRFADLPQAATSKKNYSLWGKDFSAWLSESQQLIFLRSPSLGHVSRVGESEGDFRVRLQLMAREMRDENAEKVRKKYAPKMEKLNERIRKAQMALEKEQLQAKEQKYQTAVTVGTTLLGAFLGRKGVTGARTSARDVGRSMKQQEDVKDYKENLEALQKERSDLDAEFQSEIATMEKKNDPLTEAFEKLTISAKKSNISVRLLALVWSPDS
jgi:DNA helicase HerA-like ATPase